MIIPARWASSRFPGKVLHPIAGKPLLRWVFEHARELPAAGVFVATDTPEVARAVESWGGRALLTPPDLPSGTDRIAFALKAFDLPGDFVLNLQGDEPLLQPGSLKQFLEEAFQYDDWALATLTTTFASPDEIRSPHTVKVVTDRMGRALYFSRSPIPHVRGLRTLPLDAYRKHVGVYLYRREALLSLVKHEPTPLERLEALEQLRALEHGHTIRVVHIPGLRLQAVDTPDDIARVEDLLKGI